MNRYDIKTWLVIIGLIIIGLVGLGLYFGIIIIALLWILDVVNGVHNPLDILELVGIIFLLALIFGGGSTTIKKE